MADANQEHDLLIRLDERTEAINGKMDKLTRAVEDCVKPKLTDHEVRIATMEAKTRTTVWAFGLIVGICTTIGVVVLELVIR